MGLRPRDFRTLDEVREAGGLPPLPKSGGAVYTRKRGKGGVRVPEYRKAQLIRNEEPPLGPRPGSKPDRLRTQTPQSAVTERSEQRILRHRRIYGRAQFILRWYRRWRRMLDWLDGIE